MPGPPWYWTPERLRKLGELLCSLADQDEQGYYFGGPIALNAYIVEYGKTVGLENLTEGRVKIAINILISVGALELGKSGVKRPGFKRRFYLKEVNAITWDDLGRFRAKLQPPPRPRKRP